MRAVQQVTYSGALAAQNGQRTLYVTERAVFRRNEAGKLELIEIAPGIDLATRYLRADAIQPGGVALAARDGSRVFSGPSRWGLPRSSPAITGPIRSARLNKYLAGASQ